MRVCVRLQTTHHRNPHMNDPIVQKPVTERPLRTHHIGILLGRHALAVLLGDLGPIHLGPRVLAPQRPAMRRRPVRVGLGDDVLFRACGGGAAALELGGELARVGDMADGGRGGEEELRQARWAQQRLPRQQEARDRVQRGHGGEQAARHRGVLRCGCGGPMGKIEVVRRKSAERRRVVRLRASCQMACPGSNEPLT
jgi:hypothetical protein